MGMGQNASKGGKYENPVEKPGGLDRRPTDRELAMNLNRNHAKPNDSVLAVLHEYGRIPEGFSVSGLFPSSFTAEGSAAIRSRTLNLLIP
jgi:hypothetical protein